MKLINSSYEIVEPKSYSLEDVYKHIELCGRVCYKSENKITPDSSTKFVDRMIKSGHTSVLEHGTVYLAIPMTTYASEAVSIYHNNPYSKVNKCNEFIFTDKYGDKVAAWCVTTNLRVLVENDCLEDLEFLCEPTEYHERRYTVRFIMDRIGSQSFCRHRHFSFSQESTRYCDYSKDKFKNEVTYIIPTWLDIPEGNYTYWDGDWVDMDKLKINIHDEDKASSFLFALDHCEQMYKLLKNKGCSAQEARQVLPNALKTELIMTGFASDWDHFFRLRDDKKAHPDAYKLSHDLHDEFIKRNYVYGETNNKE